MLQCTFCAPSPKHKKLAKHFGGSFLPLSCHFLALQLLRLQFPAPFLPLFCIATFLVFVAAFVLFKQFSGCAIDSVFGVHSSENREEHPTRGASVTSHPFAVWFLGIASLSLKLRLAHLHFTYANIEAQRRRDWWISCDIYVGMH